MSIELKPITALSYPKRVVDLNRLVTSTDITPNPQNEGALRRYAKLLPAAKHAGRLIAAPHLHAAVISEAGNPFGRPIGLATVIRNQTIMIESGQQRVHDLDYWLRDSYSSDEIHQKVAAALIQFSGQLVFRYDRAPIDIGPARWDTAHEDAAHNFIATIRTDHPEINRGFSGLMQPVGEPAPLVVVGEDTYGVAKDGAPVQLYVGHELITG